jgi:hypothetical protein
MALMGARERRLDHVSWQIAELLQLWLPPVMQEGLRLNVHVIECNLL